MKKKILLCWGYNRKGWIAPFEMLKNEFEFIYLYYTGVEEEEQSYTDCTKLYWNNFTSGFDILDRIRPALVLFMSIQAGYTIALNIACKKRKVPTYIFQHGLFRTYKEYRAIEQLDKQERAKTPGRKQSKNLKRSAKLKSTLPFLLKSLSSQNFFFLPFIIFFLWLISEKGMYYTLYHMPLRFRLPDKYICYTPQNATIYTELDRVGEDKFLYTGVPELDPFFNEAVVCSKADYYLLIDQAFAENRYYNFGVTREQMNACYAKLNTFCKTHGSKLVVKLHPESYKSDWLLQDANIEYVQDVDVVRLVKNARGVLGTTSTLMLPAIYFKQCYLLLIHDSYFQQAMLMSGLAKGADFFTFSPAEINFNYTPRDEMKSQFVHDYLYKADGRSVERLKSILTEA